MYCDTCCLHGSNLFDYNYEVCMDIVQLLVSVHIAICYCIAHT
jgi:hypothetical protein